MEGHKKKKPTKKQVIENVPKEIDKILKDNFIPNLVQGFGIANKMILSYIDEGHTLEEVRSFVEKNTAEKNLEVLERVAKR